MKKLLFFILFYSLSATAEIHELKSYRDLDVRLLKDSLVIFDIDNTLIRQDSEIGTHQWGDDMRETAIKNGLSKDKASSYQHKLFASVQPYLSVVPVEERIRSILKFLDQHKTPHFALTARPSSLRERTLQQLGILRHNFAKSFPAQKDPALLKPFLQEGVIFSGDTPKGELLDLILQNSKSQPKRIIFIDDKLYNLESIEKSMADNDLELISYRYGGADDYVSGYNPVVADIIYSFLVESGSVLTNVEAESLVDDMSAMTNKRFELYLNRHDPEGGLWAGTCNSSAARTFTCNYSYDGEQYQKVFKYNVSEERGSIYFGDIFKF